MIAEDLSDDRLADILQELGDDDQAEMVGLLTQARAADVLEAVGDVSASTGSACHAGVHSPNAALLAMGLDADTALGALRLSLGRSTSTEDVESAATALARGLVAL